MQHSRHRRHPISIAEFRAIVVCYAAGGALRLVRWTIYLASLGAGAAIGVWLVLGLASKSGGVTVPQVVALSQDQARFQAERQGLVFQVESERYDLTVPRGRVASQTPGAGMAVKKGQTLRVVLSKGLDRVTVPEWRGVGLSQAQVHAQQTGLKMASVAYLRSALPPQVVIAQAPAPSAVVARDSETSLLVSAGAPTYAFVTPDFTGVRLEVAQRLLGSYGIETGPTRTQTARGAEGTIVAQSPQPGYPLDRNQIVQLVVSAP